MRYDYPGNIRELENIIEYAFILCHEGPILPYHLPEPFQMKLAAEQQKEQETAPDGSDETAMTLEEIEKQAIIAALERNSFKKMQTCRELGISKDTLRRKLKAYGDIAKPSGRK